MCPPGRAGRSAGDDCTRIAAPVSLHPAARAGRRAGGRRGAYRWRPGAALAALVVLSRLRVGDPLSADPGRGPLLDRGRVRGGAHALARLYLVEEEATRTVKRGQESG